MTARLLALAITAAWPVLGQLQLLVVAGGSEQPMSPALDLGTVESGDTVFAAFRVRNPAPVAVKLEKLSVAGTGFTLLNAPVLPLVLASGAVLDFSVRFQPAVTGSHSAGLTLNSESFMLLATVIPGPLLFVEQSGQRVALFSGDAVDFGQVENGSAAARAFTLENRSSAELTIAELAVTGDAFRGPLRLGAPLTLAPGQAAAFEVRFEPKAAGEAEGSLRVNQRSFRLRGTAAEPPVPKPSLAFSPAAPRSGQQATLAIRLAAASRVSATGQVRMALTGGEDPAVRFLVASGRSASFTIQPGDDVARFGDRKEVDFQTGTTAGAIQFTVELGPYTEQAALKLDPLPVVLDSGRVTRSASGIEVLVTGFDNTRSASQVKFTFFDRGGSLLGGGAFSVDVAADFMRYFETSGLGGLFALRAVFPVKGDAALIGSVDVELTNSAGAGRRNVKMTE